MKKKKKFFLILFAVGRIKKALTIYTYIFFEHHHAILYLVYYFVQLFLWIQLSNKGNNLALKKKIGRIVYYCMFNN